MSYEQAHNTTVRKQRGFTLVELLIIAPVALLVIAGFVALMVTMVGDAIATRASNVLTYDAQNAIDTIERDVRLSTEFLTTSGTLPSPQGKDATTAPFTAASGDLILGGIATDKNPIDPSRGFVYYDTPFGCGNATTYQNRIFFVSVMYTVRDGSLWRRTYVPAAAGTFCTQPWQVNTCAPGYAPSATRCQANDSEVLKNVKNFTVEYYVNPQDTVAIAPASASTASTIRVSLELEQTAAGRAITTSSTGRSSKLTSREVNLAPPATPTVTGSTSGRDAIFSWPSVPTATAYIIERNINGGGWTTITENSTETTVSLPLNHGDTASIRVRARNTTGASDAGSASATIPLWVDCGLQNGWTNGYANHEKCTFTLTRHGVVLIQGQLLNGPLTYDSVLFTLPPEYRPSHRLIFTGLLSEQNVRIDVDANGNVRILDIPSVGANYYLSIAGISFIPAKSGYSRTGLTFNNGWSNYGGAYTPMQSIVDGAGRVHIQGMLTSGTLGVRIAPLPSGLAPAKPQIVPAHGDWVNSGYNEAVIQSDGGITARGITTSWLATQFMYYPASYAGWQTFTSVSGTPGNGQLGNGWVYYDNGGNYWANPQYTKADDGIVKIKGMIKSGSTTPGTSIAQLPTGYRPRNRLIFNVTSENGFTRLDVHPAGNITIVSGGSAGWTSLDGIQFIAEQ